MDKPDEEFVISAGDDMSSPALSALSTEQIKPLTIEDLNLDTISIDTSALNNYSYAIAGGGGGGGAGQFLNSNGSTGVWNHSTLNWPQITSIGSASSGSLNVKGDAEFDGDVKIQGHSILHLLNKIEDRLAVLQEPSPERLEKFAALKKAYEHYKTLERLIGED